MVYIYIYLKYSFNKHCNYSAVISLLIEHCLLSCLLSFFKNIYLLILKIKKENIIAKYKEKNKNKKRKRESKERAQVDGWSDGAQSWRE